MDFEELYKIIYRIYINCGLTEFPIDCFKVVRKYGYRIKRYSELTQKKKAACQKLSGDACLIEDTLYYEEHAHPGRVKFSIAHELGHAFLNTQDEDNCDCFASHFLAPRILIYTMGHQNAEQIHISFGLSYAAANRALADYRRWFNRSYFTSLQPSKPEILLAQRFIQSLPPENYKERSLQVKPSNVPNCLEITDEMLFAHLKEFPQARRKAAIHNICMDEYLMYRYYFNSK